jgi:hypothetical protein
VSYQTAFALEPENMEVHRRFHGGQTHGGATPTPTGA